MRIASVTVDLLKVPLVQPYMAAGKKISEYWHVLARVTTEDGIEGFGYVVLLNAALVKPLADATRELSQLLKGMHVFEPEAAWAKLVRAANWVGPGGLVNCAIAPLDIAMWDAAAKTANQPLYRLLGGFRDRVPAYASDSLWYSLSLDAWRRPPVSTSRTASTRSSSVSATKRRRRAKSGASWRCARRSATACVSWSMRPKRGRQTRRYRPDAHCRMPGSIGWRTRSTTRT